MNTRNIILLAALIASTTQAQTITHISERDGYSIKLGDAPCPTGEDMLNARYDSTEGAFISADGCWKKGQKETILFMWRSVAHVEHRVALPVVLPASDFLKGRK